MSWALIAGSIWVVLAACVAMLPIPRQFAPGFVLLLAVPIILAAIGHAHGWIPAVCGMIAFVSMFRRPIRFYVAQIYTGRARGQNPEIPK